MDKLQSLGLLTTQEAYLGKKSFDKTKVKDVHRVAEQFESMFVYLLLKEMRKTIPQGGLGPQMTGKDTYGMLIDMALADEIAKSSPIGILEFIEGNLRLNDDEASGAFQAKSVDRAQVSS
jgi:flagellar protein FlgJ